MNERQTKSNDMLLKTMKTLRRCFRERNSKYVHAKGCTVSVGNHVPYLSSIAKIPNVIFDPKLAMPLNVGYLKMRAHILWYDCFHELVDGSHP